MNFFEKKTNLMCDFSLFSTTFHVAVYRYDGKNLKNNKKCPEKATVRWSDDLIEKLLESVKEFKAQKEYEGVDWGSVKDKYENIRSLFIKKRRDENDNETFTRDKISSKIKAVRGNYRKAVDASRQSGGGRVVATFYELCQEIWLGPQPRSRLLVGWSHPATPTTMTTMNPLISTHKGDH